MGSTAVASCKESVRVTGGYAVEASTFLVILKLP